MSRIAVLLFAAGALLACKSEPAKSEAAKPAGKPDEPIAAKQIAAEPAKEATLLAEGAPAPEVAGKTFDGKDVSLAALRGKPVVLYFYPKDDTPGCTVEAQSFRDASGDYGAIGAAVIGVSMDGPDSHKAFAEKHKLNFPLISDTDGAIAARYGVSTSRGYARRTTFVIDKDGKIAKVFADVKVDGHSAEVLAAVKQLGG